MYLWTTVLITALEIEFWGAERNEIHRIFDAGACACSANFIDFSVRLLKRNSFKEAPGVLSGIHRNVGEFPGVGGFGQVCAFWSWRLGGPHWNGGV